MQDVLTKELVDTNIEGGNTRSQSWRTVLGRSYGPVQNLHPITVSRPNFGPVQSPVL